MCVFFRKIGTSSCLSTASQIVVARLAFRPHTCRPLIYRQSGKPQTTTVSVWCTYTCSYYINLNRTWTESCVDQKQQIVPKLRSRKGSDRIVTFSGCLLYEISGSDYNLGFLSLTKCCQKNRLYHILFSLLEFKHKYLTSIKVENYFSRAYLDECFSATILNAQINKTTN